MMYMRLLVVLILQQQVREVAQVALVADLEELNEIFLRTVNSDPALHATYILAELSVLEKELLTFFGLLDLSLRELLDLLLLLEGFLLLPLQLLDIESGLGSLLFEDSYILIAQLIELIMNELGHGELNVVEILVQEVHVLDLIQRCVDLIISRLEEALGVAEELQPLITGIDYTILLKVENYECKLLDEYPSDILKCCTMESDVTLHQEVIFDR